MISNKKRNTIQKRFVADYLSSHYDHPTAEAIYEAGKKDGLRLGLTTVYRILEGLRQEGLIVVIAVKDEIHYDWVRDDHYHFVCDECGKILDLQQDQDLFDSLSKRHDFSLLSLQGVVVHGLCEDCAKKAEFAKGGKMNYGKRNKASSNE